VTEAFSLRLIFLAKLGQRSPLGIARYLRWKTRMYRRSLLIAGLGLVAGMTPATLRTAQTRIGEDVGRQVGVLLSEAGLVAVGDWRHRGQIVTLFAEGRTGRYRVAIDLGQNAIVGMRASQPQQAMAERQAAR
jgi:hypothetical protein